VNSIALRVHDKPCSALRHHLFFAWRPRPAGPGLGFSSPGAERQRRANAYGQCTYAHQLFAAQWPSRSGLSRRPDSLSCGVQAIDFVLNFSERFSFTVNFSNSVVVLDFAVVKICHGRKKEMKGVHCTQIIFFKKIDFWWGGPVKPI